MEEVLRRVLRWWNKLNKKRLILMAALFVISFAVTSLIKWKPLDFATYQLKRDTVDAGVYATAGDACIYLCVLLLGGPWGAGIATAAMVLSDIVLGSKLYIIGTLFIKTAMALFIAAYGRKCESWGQCFAISGIAEAAMVILYFFYDLLFVNFSVSLRGLLMNLIQAGACIVLGALILRYVPAVRPKSMPKPRRSSRTDSDEDEFQWK